MNETPMDDPFDRQLGQFLAWYADSVAATASTDDVVVERLLARKRRRVGWSAPAHLRRVGLAAVLAAIIAAVVAAGLLIGNARPRPVELAPAPPAVDLLAEQTGRHLVPATYAVHGFRPPFTFSLPAARADSRWVTCCDAPTGNFVALSEDPAGNVLYVMSLPDAVPIAGTYCDNRPDTCPDASLANVGQGGLTPPPVYWVATIERGGELITLLAGSDTRATLDEFLPRAQVVFDSLDFDSGAITLSPAPGTEPLPPPPGYGNLFIGSQGFGREIRYVPASHARALVTVDEAIAVAAAKFREMLAANSKPAQPAEPIAVVRRIVIEAKETFPEPRSVWIVAFETADGETADATFVDDQTGETRGGFGISGWDPSFIP